MAGRIRAVVAFVVVLVAGAFLGSALSQRWQDRAVGAGAVPGPRGGARVRVEVLNAGGASGMARKATERLRERGFDVVYFGNARTFGRDSSLVIDRVGDVRTARSVADALGIRRVRSLPDSNLYLDVSVLLGTDWTPAPARPEGEENAGRAWWDPRGWWRQ